MKVETREEDWVELDSQLCQEFKFETFVDAMKFVNMVAELAEEQDHHPEIKINYNRVMIKTYTHDTNSISELDYQLTNSINVKLKEVK